MEKLVTVAIMHGEGQGVGSMFSKLIQSVENEINLAYIPGAIAYVDANSDSAWSKAMDRFDRALFKSLQDRNPELAKLEADIFKNTLQPLIALYKSYRRGGKVESVFAMLQGKPEVAEATQGELPFVDHWEF